VWSSGISVSLPVFPIWTFGKPGPLFSGRLCPGAQCK
jgi:hypothetical protein